MVLENNGKIGFPKGGMKVWEKTFEQCAFREL